MFGLRSAKEDPSSGRCTQDLTPERLDDMWAIAFDHTLLALHLRRSSEGITVSATVRFTTAQPQLTPPGRHEVGFRQPT